MEKQIMIKHSYSDRTLKIKNTISYLELFVDSLSDKIVINCCLNANQSKIIDEIMRLKHSGIVDSINLEIDKKHYNFNITTSMDNVIHILSLIENYELNVMIYCNGIKMFINDNDGDFIIINSNHGKYSMIKNKNN
ncbi:MAG: hypothetical protein V8R16_02760 [Bacilli bacterium]